MPLNRFHRREHASPSDFASKLPPHRSTVKHFPLVPFTSGPQIPKIKRKSQPVLCCLEQSLSLPTLFAKSSQNTTEQQQHFRTLSSFLTLPVKCNLTVVYWLGFVEQQDNRSMVWKEKADEWSSPSHVKLSPSHLMMPGESVRFTVWPGRCT